MKQTEVDLLKSLIIKKSKMKSENSRLKLENTAECLKARIVSLDSNKLFQKTRNGYNLADIKKDIVTVNGLTITPLSDGGIKIVGTTTRDLNIGILNPNNFPILKANKSYNLAVKVVGTINKVPGANVIIAGRTSTTNILGDAFLSSDNTTINGARTLTEDTTLNNVIFFSSGIGNVIDCVIYVSILEGSYTQENLPPFEQYGAMPSLDFESPVEGVSEDVVNKIQNKNVLLLEDVEETTVYGVKYSVKNGVINLNGTSSSPLFLELPLKKPIKIKDNSVLSYVANKIVSERKIFSIWLSNNDDKNLVGNLYVNNLKGAKDVLTIEQEVTKIRLYIGEANIQFNEIILKSQLEEGTVSTDIVEAKQQNYTISLGNKTLYGNENAKDGIVLKNGKWNWKWAWKKYIFTGNENFRKYNPDAKRNFFFTSIFANTIKLNNTTYNVKSNFFVGVTNENFEINKENNEVWNNAKGDLYFQANSISTIEDLKTKLQELNTAGKPLYIVYQLAEPIMEEITDINLITQLNKLLNQIQEYDDETLITSDKEIEFEVIVEQDNLRILKNGGNIND